MWLDGVLGNVGQEVRGGERKPDKRNLQCDNMRDVGWMLMLGLFGGVVRDWEKP